LTWQQSYAGIIPDEYLQNLNSEQRLPMWERMLNPANWTTPPAIFVAADEGKLIGFSTGGPSGDEDAKPGTGELYSIYLLQEFWGHGIGRDLHDALLDELRAREFNRTTLWVLEANDRTRRWYERQSWTWDGSAKPIELGAMLTEVRYKIDLGQSPD
jgi:GNAT superfamily N-acetyltransferase